MSSSHLADSVTSGGPAGLADVLNARIRVELAARFAWPSSSESLRGPLHDLSSVMDLGELASVAAVANQNKEIGFTIVSKEYLQTGLNWVHAMRRLGLSNFLVVAGDRVTFTKLSELGVPSVLAEVDSMGLDDYYLSHDGFSAKGLAMIALKFPVAKFLLESGYDVIFSDADAIWLHDPMAYVRDADIAFQRVAYHPAPIASLWGFTACTGFFRFRHDPGTIAFVTRCIEEQKSFRCDQVSLNLALLEEAPSWCCDDAGWTPPGHDIGREKAEREAVFAKVMHSSIEGDLPRSGLKVLALPHDKFWRHDFVSSPLRDIVICHPNSPKHDLGKMKVFDAMGIRMFPGDFQPRPRE